ncbi:MAG: universal stress protein [Chitinophagaceae bacterium]|nr:universal stress protein [Chitinophagaceae bacterium]
MKNILVPTDFSAESINAVEYAADMASSLNLSLNLVHIYQPPTSAYAELPMPPVEMEKSLDELEAHLEQLHLSMEKRTAGKVPVKMELRVGNIRTEILDIAKETEPMIVVMGSHGAGKMERLLLGSHTLWASKHLPCPLIIVPGGVKFEKIARIGLAWNYRPLKDMAPLNKIRDLVKAFDAELHVICIMKNSSDRLSDKLLTEANRFQEEFSEMKTHYSFIVDKEVSRSILEFSEKQNLDMMIVIPSKHDLIGTMIHHSESKQMALHSKWPLLSIHE